MSEIEKIQRYIERTAIPHDLSVRYDCYPGELLALFTKSRHPYNVVSLAFEYGKAKGYRAGKKAAALERKEAHAADRQRTAAPRPAALAERRAVV